MRRSLAFLGICALGTCLGRSAALAQDEVIQAHALSRQQASCSEPQRIVVKLPPPRVEYQDNSSESSSSSSSSRKCNLFTCRHRAEPAHHHGAPMASVLYAPVNLPAMVVQPSAAATTSFTQQITHDFSSLQNAHELEMRAAALAAHSAAKRAMADAENELLQSSLDRVHKKMSAMASAAAPSAAAAAGGRVSLETALQNLDNRLTKLEDLVLQHQQLLQQKETKTTPPEPKKESK